MSPYRERVKILRNINVRGSYFKLSFESARFAKYSDPGQFMLIKADSGLEPFLRKPFGFHRVDRNNIEALYEIVGKGTEILSSKKPGDHLDIIGPLGKGFNYRGQRTEDRGQILVAGGIGVAALVFLAEELKNQRTKERKNTKVVALIGAKTKRAILCEREFKDLGCEVMVATDDGSKGHKGFVTDLLEQVLLGRGTPCGCPKGGHKARPYTIYACGPKPMMKETARIAAQHKVPCQVLLEEYMACGVGVCLGCAVMTKDGYKMVCKDGPVFNAEEVIWEV